MSIGFKGVSLAGAALTAAMLVSAPVQAGWLTDSAGAVVTNSVGECWQTGYATDKVFDKCGDKVEPPPAEVKQAPPVVKDSDGDGVPDDQDKCPGTPRGAKVDKYGCELLEPIVLQDGEVHFAFDKAMLTPKAKEVLDEVARKAKPQMERVKMIYVTGHTDATGPEAYNQKLSVRRAGAVADYMKETGIPSDKVKVIGKGESMPIATNKTKEGRAKNRRVEIEFETMQ